MAVIAKLPCRCCRADTDHEMIVSVSAGQLYFACKACQTVQHIPRPQEATS